MVAAITPEAPIGRGGRSGEEICLCFTPRLLERVKWPVDHRGVPEHDPPPNAYALDARGNDATGGAIKGVAAPAEIAPVNAPPRGGPHPVAHLGEQVPEASVWEGVWQAPPSQLADR